MIQECKISPPKGKSEQDTRSDFVKQSMITYTQRLSWSHSTGYEHRLLEGPFKVDNFINAEGTHLQHKLAHTLSMLGW